MDDKMRVTKEGIRSMTRRISPACMQRVSWRQRFWTVWPR